MIGRVVLCETDSVFALSFTVMYSRGSQAKNSDRRLHNKIEAKAIGAIQTALAHDLW